MKQCPECKIDSENFGPHPYTKDRRQRLCRECQKAYSRKRYKEKRLEILEKCKANRPILRDKEKERYWKDPEKARAKALKYFNPEKGKMRDKRRRKEHYREVLANNAKRRAIKLRAIPKWADLKAIKDFYEKCPPGHHVDHIWPLKGKDFCGLHVLNNLQYLPAKENLQKNNKRPDLNK